MTERLSLPSIAGINTDGMTYGEVVFLSSLREGLVTLDKSVLYKDAIDVTVPTPRIRAVSAEGQAFSISNVTVASGEDFAKLVSDTKTMLEDLNSLRQTVEQMAKQLQGK